MRLQTRVPLDRAGSAGRGTAGRGADTQRPARSRGRGRRPGKAATGMAFRQ